MDMRADVTGVVGRNGPATRKRLEWLAGLCLLSWREEQMLALLIGLGDAEPARRWWSKRALADHFASDGKADATVVAAALSPDAGLCKWGLVRTDGDRVAVNLRIARFLLG
jgi:hypothetical protein